MHIPHFQVPHLSYCWLYTSHDHPLINIYTGYPREIQAATQQLLVILWRPIGAEVLPRGRGAAFRGSAAALCRLAPGEEQHADVVT
jgi:hypothetical protein